MNEDAPQGVDRLPTLTEVVEMEPVEAGPAAEAAAALPAEPDLTASVAQPLPLPLAVHDACGVQPQAGAPALDEQALITQVLAEMNPRIDMLFQSRLREALAPALAHAADVLIRDARDEMSASLRELVQDAVARALQRRSDR